MIMISKEAENLLFEIIEHESDGNHWAERFEAADHREDIILRGCFKELKDNNGDVENLWIADATMKFNLKNGKSLTAKHYYISFTCLDGQMYVATENLSEIVFE